MISSPSPRRPGLTNFRLLLIVLAFQLAMIPFGMITQHSGLRALRVGDFDKRGFDAGPEAWIAWKTYPAEQWTSPEPRVDYGIPGLRYTVCGGIASFVVVSFFWTIGLNIAAILWFGRQDILHGWRNRPRLPKIRLHLTIERRPRPTA